MCLVLMCGRVEDTCKQVCVVEECEVVREETEVIKEGARGVEGTEEGCQGMVTREKSFRRRSRLEHARGASHGRLWRSKQRAGRDGAWILSLIELSTPVLLPSDRPHLTYIHPYMTHSPCLVLLCS